MSTAHGPCCRLCLQVPHSRLHPSSPFCTVPSSPSWGPSTPTSVCDIVIAISRQDVRNQTGMQDKQQLLIKLKPAFESHFFPALTPVRPLTLRAGP